MPLRDICFHMTTKKCSKCGAEKSQDCFYSDASKKTGFRPDCKECLNKRNKTKYHTDIAHKEKKRKGITTRRKENQIKVLRIQKNTGCIDCGETDPVVLDFDHTTGNKTSGICRMINNHAPWERIEQEIAKCVVRCANCHRRKTAIAGNFYDGIDLVNLCYSGEMGTTDST